MPHARPVTVFFMVVFVLVGLLMARLLGVFLGAIMLAAALASLSLPVQSFLQRKVGSRRLAALLTTAILVVCVVAPLSGLVVSLGRQGYDVYLASREVSLAEEVRALFVSEHPVAVQLRRGALLLGMDTSPEGVVDASASVLTQIGVFFSEQIGGIAANTLSLFLDFVVMTLLVFTFLAEGPRLKRWVMELSPLPSDEEEELIRRFVLIGRAVFLGNGVSGLLQGLLGGLGFMVAGLGNSLLWGSVMGFLALLPVAGASVVFVPAAGWLLVQGRTGAAVAFLIWNLAYVGVVEYVLKPKLIGGSSRMNSVFVFISILAGLKLFGLLGLFYGPLFVAMFLALAELYLARYRHAIHGPPEPLPVEEENPGVALEPSS